MFRDAPPPAFLAGHDHGLQVLSGGAVRLRVLLVAADGRTTEAFAVWLDWPGVARPLQLIV